MKQAVQIESVTMLMRCVIKYMAKTQKSQGFSGIFNFFGNYAKILCKQFYVNFVYLKKLAQPLPAIMARYSPRSNISAPYLEKPPKNSAAHKFKIPSSFFWRNLNFRYFHYANFMSPSFITLPPSLSAHLHTSLCLRSDQRRQHSANHHSRPEAQPVPGKLCIPFRK